jgi:hypothetical protein
MNKLTRQQRMVGSVGCLLVTLLLVTSVGTATAEQPSAAWSSAQKIDEIAGNSSELNTTSVDGCPIQSPDGLRLYMASNRPGGVGGLDIWVARRASTGAPWGAPSNLGAPVNSESDDFCPTPVRGGGLLFVSRKTHASSCGMGDIYSTRLDRRTGWREPRHMACAPAGPNTALDEQGPSYAEADGREFLYFSSGPDIFVSERPLGGSFGAGQAVTELNGTASDIQPNVRKDGREIVFASNDAGRPGLVGGFDIYTATRDSIDDPWSAPVNVGSSVNTAANETRPSLSWDARQLLFGRAPGPEGMNDIYVSTRE